DELSGYLRDSLPSKEFDDIVELASLICQASTAYISLVVGDAMIFQSVFGLKTSDLEKYESLFERIITAPEESLVISDMRIDERFKSHPLVSQNDGFVFFVGIPLKFKNERIKGSLCVLDNSLM